MYNNCISYILNDILKHIFLKQQQQQLQSSSSQLHDTQPLTQQDTAKELAVVHQTPTILIVVLGIGGSSIHLYRST